MLSWIEISRSALEHNIKQIEQLTVSNQLGFVLKANAYGHGMLPIAQLIDEISTAQWLCTAGVEEALRLRQAGWSRRLLVMAYVHDASLDAVLHSDIDIIVDECRTLYQIAATASRLGVKAHVHIKVDTGLGRRGVSIDKVLELFQAFACHPHLSLVGLCTHLSDTVKQDQSFTQIQLSLFHKVVEQLRSARLTIPYVHAIGSGGLFMLRTKQADYSTLVRVGSHLYGLWKSPEQQKLLLEKNPDFSLRGVFSWKAPVIEVLEKSSKRLALLPIGIEQGYPYILIGKAFIEIEGMLAPLIDSIEHTFLVADITHIPHARRGTVVTLMGNVPGLELGMLATQAGTVVNEVLARLSPAIKRVVVD